MTAAASTVAELRVGRCPGALRPMMSGDGLVVRVKPRGMALSAAGALGIAAAAARHGSGQLELTARANLQIRGATEASLPALTAELDALGLLDADAEAEARRNVIASPLMGLDPAAAFDVRPALAALEAALVGAAGLDMLPSKFGFAVSDGGATALGDVSADVRFDALPVGMPGGSFAVRLDGAEAATVRCAAAEVPAVALRLARTFVAAAAVDAGLRRMRDLVAAIGAPEIASRAGLVATPDQPALLPSPLWRGVGGEGEATVFGDGAQVHPLHGTPLGPSPLTPLHEGEGRLHAWYPTSDGRGALAVAAPFGRLDAAQLGILARAAARAGAPELRLTPWRAFLVPGLLPAACDRLAADCGVAGWIVDPADPRLSVVACAGAPGCRRGTTPVLDDAAELAGIFSLGDWPGDDPGDGIALHVSGCAKGCAHPGRAPLTLVGTEGRYALVVDGAAHDAPVAAGLDLAEARRLLKTALRLDRRP